MSEKVKSNIIVGEGSEPCLSEPSHINPRSDTSSVAHSILFDP